MPSVARRHPIRSTPTSPAPRSTRRLLHELGCVEQHVRLQVYGHVLPSSASLVDWVRGTNLIRIFAALPPDLHEPFVDAYRTALLDRIGEQAPYFYAFKRILFRGTAPG